MLETILRDVAVAVYAAAFAVLCARAGLDWRVRRDRASLWFAIAFAALFVAVAANQVAVWLAGDPSPTWLARSTVVVLAVFAPAILQFAAAFGGISRAERVVAWAWFGALGAWAAVALDLPAAGARGTDAFVAFSIAFVAGWLVVSLRVVVTLVLRSRTALGVVRGRMRLLAAGFTMLGLALMVQAIDVDAKLPVIVAIMSAGAAVLLVLGIAPPQWLRILLRQREQQELREAVAGIASATTEAEVLQLLLPATRRALGVQCVALVPFDGSEVLAIGYDDATVDSIRSAVRGLVLPEGVDSAIVDGHLVTRSVASWIVVDARRHGSFVGTDEYVVLGSMEAIVRMSLARIRDASSIREHEQLLQTAVDLAELGKWYWDIDSDHMWWSARMYEVYGIDPGEPLTHDRYRSLIAAEDRDRVKVVVDDAIRRRAPYQVEHRVVRPDGGHAWVQSRARITCDDDGEPRRITGVTMDVTERVRAEQELRDEVAAEREVARRLRDIDELKSNILSAVSHELRTPLTSVHGFAVLLQDRMEELEPARRGEVVDHLVTEAERLAQLFSDLLDIDRLRRGVIDAQRSDVDVRALVANIVAHRERRERFVLDIDVPTCRVDAPKVERIVENLITNAEKYGDPEGSVRVGGQLEDGVLELRVEDEGPGVPEELRESIFEPFNRGNAALGHAPGTGIGLSLVRQFARLHGGRAWVEDAPRGGATFVVQLPDAADAAGTGTSPAA